MSPAPSRTAIAVVAVNTRVLTWTPIPPTATRMLPVAVAALPTQTPTFAIVAALPPPPPAVSTAAFIPALTPGPEGTAGFVSPLINTPTPAVVFTPTPVASNAIRPEPEPATDDADSALALLLVLLVTLIAMIRTLADRLKPTWMLEDDTNQQVLVEELDPVTQQPVQFPSAVTGVPTSNNPGDLMDPLDGPAEDPEKDALIAEMTTVAGEVLPQWEVLTKESLLYERARLFAERQTLYVIARNKWATKIPNVPMPPLESETIRHLRDDVIPSLNSANFNIANSYVRVGDAVANESQRWLDDLISRLATFVTRLKTGGLHAVAFFLFYDWLVSATGFFHGVLNGLGIYSAVDILKWLADPERSWEYFLGTFGKTEKAVTNDLSQAFAQDLSKNPAFAGTSTLGTMASTVIGIILGNLAGGAAGTTVKWTTTGVSGTGQAINVAVNAQSIGAVVGTAVGVVNAVLQNISLMSNNDASSQQPAPEQMPPDVVEKTPKGRPYNAGGRKHFNRVSPNEIDQAIDSPRYIMKQPQGSGRPDSTVYLMKTRGNDFICVIVDERGVIFHANKNSVDLLKNSAKTYHWYAAPDFPIPDDFPF